MNHYLDSLHIEYKTDVSMSERTWIHRGPQVPLYILPRNRDEMISVLEYLIGRGMDYLVVGHTSNIYLKDTFRTDAIVCTSKMTTYEDNGCNILCDAGVNISKLSKYCVEHGYAGFEGLVGLPGTVGAAIVNNSSCFNCCASDFLLDADVLIVNSTGKCEIKTFMPSDFEFRHRSSNVKRKEKQAYILRVRFAIHKNLDIECLREKAKYNVEERKRTQEGKVQNLGSVFSGYKPNPLSLTSLGAKNIFRVLRFRIWDHYNRNTDNYLKKRIDYLLKLYGYSDLIKYVSIKNINCFIWKDDDADKAFERYQVFMHRYAKCEPMEIEIFE